MEAGTGVQPKKPTSRSRLLSELIDSDQRYFEAGAEREPLPAGWLAVMTAFPTIPAGCCAVRVEPRSIVDPKAWVDALEARVLPRRARPRLYLQQRAEALERVLAERGYAMTAETAYVFTDPPALSGVSVSMTEVDDAAGWLAKERIHEQVLPPPHGETVGAARWTAFERAKCQAGYMVPVLVKAHGEVCGSISLADSASMLRMKNLVVVPSWRRRGIANAIIGAAVGEAKRRGKIGAGLFALENTVPDRIYQRLGGMAVGQQYEWMR